MSAAATIIDILARVRAERPLVHCISNFVTLEPVANCLLALGASPIMAHSEDEVAEVTAHADALVLNIGTISKGRAQAQMRAGEAANTKGIPIVLDPVGVGATNLRRNSAKALLALSPDVVRGNGAEFMALAGLAGQAKGVDSVETSEDLTRIASAFAEESDLTVAITGEVDWITDGASGLSLRNGDAMMGRLTGMGCALSGLTGACLAVSDQPFDAAVAAVAIHGIAGEIAAEKASGPGSFQVALLDALYNLSAADIETRLKL